MNKSALASIGMTAIVLAACSDATTGTNNNSNLVPSSMAAAFSSMPAGFEQLSTSFNSSDTGSAFMPDFDGHGDRRGRGGRDDDHGDDRGGPGFGLGGLMGGGLGGFLMGDGLVNDHFFHF